MSWRKEQRRAERGYHHGNLKEALLQAALGLIAEKGAAGFTFADAARMAGVSPAAPYRHFRDREELLSLIAKRGFEQFEAVLTEAWDDGRPDTVTAFERVGKAYLAFARNEPAFYSAMFESGLPVDLSPALLAASERAFGIIRAAAERLAALAPPGVPRPPAMMIALHIWSMSHGVASLFARGDAARRKLPMTAEDLLEAEVLIYLRGLGFLTEQRPSAQREMAYTADVNRWRGPAAEPYYRPHMLDSPWHPGWIAVTVLGFIIWWPIGLALLFFTLGSRKMACWSNGDRFSNKMERMQYKMERMRDRMERRGFPFGPPTSGNRAFDEYRMETLRRLGEEQTQFKAFPDRLRHAKDKEEVDQFMAQHRTRPTPPPTNGQPQA